MEKHNINQNAARNELAKALFIRDDVLKQIRHLSGGEKSKLTLCSLTYDQVNFMILDEPTNHLDIDSREVLEEMLLEFKGTILFISHDRYFIRKIATRVGEIEDCAIVYYEGDYDYYRYQKHRLRTLEIKPEKTTVKKQISSKTPSISQEEIEAKLFALEEDIIQLNQQMLAYGADVTKLQELFLLKEKLEAEYEELFLELEDQE